MFIFFFLYVAEKYSPTNYSKCKNKWEEITTGREITKREREKEVYICMLRDDSNRIDLICVVVFYIRITEECFFFRFLTRVRMVTDCH